MKVLDFEWQKFDNFASRILSDINNLGAKNILVIGVADGGIPIAEHFAKYLRMNGGLRVSESSIRCQRPSTQQKKSNPKKEKILRKIFSATPKPILNLMRIIEHHKLSRRANSDQRREIIASPDLERLSGLTDVILIVDDAVDSGASLKLVTEHIKKTAPSEVVIKTLAVTITQRSPLITPDYFLLSGVLVRFPWSLDAK